MESIEKIKFEFERIKKLGFIKSNRENNKDGGIGNTFEDYLGVLENNLKDPDFEGFEVKTQRDLTKSYITLFSSSPSFPIGANAILKEKYGEVRDINFPDLKKLYASIFGDKFSKVYGKFFMKLEVNKPLERIYLIIKTDGVVDDEVYWDFEKIKIGLSKLNKLWVVIADHKIVNGIDYYYYKNSKVYVDINFNKFIYLLENGFIQFDMRMGVHKSGKNYGKPHDHGSGFRIKKESIENIFDNVIDL